MVSQGRDAGSSSSSGRCRPGRRPRRQRRGRRRLSRGGGGGGRARRASEGVGGGDRPRLSVRAGGRVLFEVVRVHGVRGGKASLCRGRRRRPSRRIQGAHCVVRGRRPRRPSPALLGEGKTEPVERANATAQEGQSWRDDSSQVRAWRERPWQGR